MTDVIHELFFSSTGESEEVTSGDQKIIWKDVLREGEFALTPGSGSIRRKPFKVVVNGESSASDRIISMSDIVQSHRDKAFEHVTIPTRHEDKLLDNTGFVQDLRIKQKDDGSHVLQAGLGFTEPDVAGKVRRGTIPNVSCGIFFDFVRKADGKKFRSALKHVALTHTPWINKLDPFKAVLASDDEIEEDVEVEGYQFADSTDDGKVEIKWNQHESSNWIRQNVQRQLNGNDAGGDSEPSVGVRSYYYVEDVAPKQVLLIESGPASDRRFVAPYKVEDDAVALSPTSRWTEVKEAIVTASDDSTVDFADMSVDKISEKLSAKLSDTLGPHAKAYEVEEITLDNRARISSKVDGATWIANFSVLPNGSVILDPSSSWESIEAPERKEQKKDSTPSNGHSKSIKLADTTTMDGRVHTARERRRLMMSSSAN